MVKETTISTKPLNCDIDEDLVNKLNKRKRDVGIPLKRQIEDALRNYFEGIKGAKG